jgi:hypothetical protein
MLELRNNGKLLSGVCRTDRFSAQNFATDRVLSEGSFRTI